MNGPDRYIHTYVHTYMHACMHAYIHTYIHLCRHTYTYMSANLFRTHTHTHARDRTVHGTLQVIHFTSHHTTSHVFEPIYIPRAVNTGTYIQQGDLFYSAGLHRNRRLQPTQEKSWEVLKNCRWMDRKGRNKQGRDKSERTEWENGELSWEFMEWNTVERAINRELDTRTE